MRISLTVTSSGDCWSVGLPKVRLADCFPSSGDGKAERFDEAAFRRAVAKSRAVQFASDDRGCVCAFAALLIASLGEWMDDNDRNGDDATADVRRAVRSIASRFKRGVSANVRIDLSAVVYTPPGGLRSFRTVKVRIRHDDMGFPAAVRFDRDCALVVADFCQCYSRKFVERGDPPLVFTPETEDLLAELHVRTANADRRTCERNLGGYCSPPKFDCPHYRDGKCADICPVRGGASPAPSNGAKGTRP